MRPTAGWRRVLLLSNRHCEILARNASPDVRSIMAAGSDLFLRHPRALAGAAKLLVDGSDLLDGNEFSVMRTAIVHAGGVGFRFLAAT
jgi:hypothetical protein